MIVMVRLTKIIIRACVHFILELLHNRLNKSESEGKSEGSSFLIKNDIKLFRNTSNLGSNIENLNDYRRKSDSDALSHSSADLRLARQKLIKYAHVQSTDKSELSTDDVLSKVDISGLSTDDVELSKVDKISNGNNNNSSNNDASKDRTISRPVGVNDRNLTDSSLSSSLKRSEPDT